MHRVIVEGGYYPVLWPDGESYLYSNQLRYCQDDMFEKHRWHIVEVVEAYERLIEMSGAARERVFKAIRKARKEKA